MAAPELQAPPPLQRAEAEETPLAPPTPGHAPLAELLAWAAQHGAHFPVLHMDPGDPRGYVAARPIPALEPIVTLPQQLLMHAATALADPEYGPAFAELRREAVLQVRPACTRCTCAMLVCNRKKYHVNVHRVICGRLLQPAALCTSSHRIIAT